MRGRRESEHQAPRSACETFPQPRKNISLLDKEYMDIIPKTGSGLCTGRKLLEIIASERVEASLQGEEGSSCGSSCRPGALAVSV